MFHSPSLLFTKLSYLGYPVYPSPQKGLPVGDEFGHVRRLYLQDSGGHTCTPHLRWYWYMNVINKTKFQEVKLNSPICQTNCPNLALDVHNR